MVSTHSVVILLFAVWLAYYTDVFSRKLPSVVTDNLNATYDYIVVGGGSAGSVLASRLSEDPENTVLLLEAGGDYTEKHIYHVPFKFFELQKTPADWEYYTVPQTHSCQGMKEHRSMWPRGKVLGASSIFNSMIYTRGSRHEYDEWERLGCTGWGYKDVLPYFLKSEDMTIDGLKTSKYHSTGASCSKLTTSLVNVSLKFQTLILQIHCYFLLKKCENPLQCKYFLLKKCENPLHCKGFSHFFNKK